MPFVALLPTVSLASTKRRKVKTQPQSTSSYLIVSRPFGTNLTWNEMTILQVIDPLPPIGFTIFRAEPEFRRKLHLKDFVLVPREYIATAVVAGEITLQEGEYFVMVACDKPKYSNTYTLEIESATAQFTIEEPAPYHIISLSVRNALQSGFS